MDITIIFKYMLYYEHFSWDSNSNQDDFQQSYLCWQQLFPANFTNLAKHQSGTIMAIYLLIRNYWSIL
jgi:hypothetical protein